MLRRTAFALISALSLLAGAAQAAEPSIEVTPFLGSIARSAWQPFTVTITNPADAPAISGEVRFNLSDPRGNVPDLGSWSRPVQIAPGASTQVTITTNIPEDALPVAKVTLMQGSGQASHIVASKKFDGLRLRPGNAIIVLDLTGKPDTLGKLGQISTLETDFQVAGGTLIAPRGYSSAYQKSGMAPRQTMVNYSSRILLRSVSPEELPADALGLNSVTAVYTDTTTVLTPEQQQLLDRYVAAGGIIVTEARDRDTISSQGLGVRASLRPNSVRGWLDTLRLRAKQRSVLTKLTRSEFQSYSELNNVAIAGDGTAPLPFDSLLLFLGTYLIVLVPVQYAVLKRLGKREWAWGVTPALAVLFAMAAYGFGQRGRSRETFLNVGSIIETEAGSSTGHALSGIGLFSPVYRSYALGVQSAGPTRLRDGNGFGGSAESLVSGVPTLRNLSVPMWSIKQVSATSEVTLGKGLEVKRSKGMLTLTNHMGQTIHSLDIGNYRKIDLQPGQTYTFSFQDYNGYPITPQHASLPTQHMMERLASLIESWRNSEVPVITGWLYESPLQLQLDGKPVAPRHQATLLVVHVPSRE